MHVLVLDMKRCLLHNVSNRSCWRRGGGKGEGGFIMHLCSSNKKLLSKKLNEECAGWLLSLKNARDATEYRYEHFKGIVCLDQWSSGQSCHIEHVARFSKRCCAVTMRVEAATARVALVVFSQQDLSCSALPVPPAVLCVDELGLALLRSHHANVPFDCEVGVIGAAVREGGTLSAAPIKSGLNSIGGGRTWPACAMTVRKSGLGKGTRAIAIAICCCQGLNCKNAGCGIPFAESTAAAVVTVVDEADDEIVVLVTKPMDSESPSSDFSADVEADSESFLALVAARLDSVSAIDHILAFLGDSALDSLCGACITAFSLSFDSLDVTSAFTGAPISLTFDVLLEGRSQGSRSEASISAKSSSSSSPGRFLGDHVILFSFLRRRRAFANQVDTCVRVIFVSSASIIFSAFVG